MNEPNQEIESERNFLDGIGNVILQIVKYKDEAGYNLSMRLPDGKIYTDCFVENNSMKQLRDYLNEDTK